MLAVSSDDITEGNLLRSLLLLAVPLLVQNVVQVLQQVVDIIFLGRLSADAVAAVGLVTPLLGLLFAGVFVAFVGTQIVVSRRVGARNTVDARSALFTGLAMALGIGILLGGVMVVAADPLLHLLVSVRPGGGQAVTGLAIRYLTVLALGLPIIAFTDTLEGGFVAHGDSRASLYMNVVALGGNVLLDPLLIFGLGPFPRLGITGAAVATVAGTTGGVIVGAILVARGRNGGMLSRAAATVDLDAVREIFSIGGPVGGQQGVRHLLRLPLFLLVFLAGGPAGLAAYTIGARVASIAFIPPQGLQQAAQSVVGQNLGGNNPARAGKTTWIGVFIASGTLLGIGVLQWLLPGTIASAFAPTLSADGFALTVEYLRILAIGYPALGAIYLFEAGFNGADRSTVSFLSTTFQYGAVRLPFAAIAVLLLDGSASSVFWAVTVSNVAAALWLAWYYHYAVSDGMMRRAATATT